jgi:hypothetical protein
MPMERKYSCAHCGCELQAFELPEAGGWAERYHYVCFNDDCPYYRNGWDWMMSQYSRKASYRYQIDPVSGHESPLAVWSPMALRDRIVKPELNGETLLCKSGNPDEQE